VPRVGLVLGAGGVVGVAFHAGVLCGLSEGLGWDPRTVDLVVGTSAGSVTAAGLRAGIAAGDLYARVCGTKLSPEAAERLSRSERFIESGRESNPARLPAGMPAAPGVLVSAGLRPWKVRPAAVLAGLLPPGAVSTQHIADGVDVLYPNGWPSLETWICAVRLDTGLLTVFGRRGSPRVGMGEAVAASCAIPGYFTPVSIGGRRYVDGGAHSLTNLAGVAHEGLDLVVVSAPMSRTGPRGRGIRAVMREANRLQLQAEAARVRRAGTPVIAFSPTPGDLEAMGGNPMDRARQAPVARQARISTMSRLERSDVLERISVLARDRSGASPAGDR
jgi:NTE family protein